MTRQDVDGNEIKKLALRIRLETLKELVNLGFGHVGGSMSICETLAVLYGKEMRYDPVRPDWEGRDRLIVSKGHSGPAIYAALALSGFFSTERLKTLNVGGTSFPSHCDRSLTTGIDMTTGSLGQGLSVGLGVALAQRIDNRDSYTFVIVGDGEFQEGQNWEAVMTAGQMKLGRLIMFFDFNKAQMNGQVADINDQSNIEARMREFGWHVQLTNGHDVDQITQAVQLAKDEKERPSCIVLDTIKGYGCEYALSQPVCHSLPMPLEKVQPDISRLEKEIEALEERQSL